MSRTPAGVELETAVNRVRERVGYFQRGKQVIQNVTFYQDDIALLLAAYDAQKSCEVDAKRYRWLRDRRGGYIEVTGPEGDEREQYLYDTALDAAVDSAMKDSPQPLPGKPHDGGVPYEAHKSYCGFTISDGRQPCDCEARAAAKLPGEQP